MLARRPRASGTKEGGDRRADADTPVERIDAPVRLIPGRGCGRDPVGAVPEPICRGVTPAGSSSGHRRR
jgi:hypothetical protein